MSLHAVPWACMQFPELTWSSMSLHAVSWACIQFHELVCSSFLCLSSSQEFRSACYQSNTIGLSARNAPTNLSRRGSESPKRAWKISMWSHVSQIMRNNSVLMLNSKKEFHFHTNLVILVQFTFNAIITSDPHHPHPSTADKGQNLLSEKLPVPPFSSFIFTSKIKLVLKKNNRSWTVRNPLK